MTEIIYDQDCKVVEFRDANYNAFRKPPKEKTERKPSQFGRDIKRAVQVQTAKACVGLAFVGLKTLYKYGVKGNL